MGGGSNAKIHFIASKDFTDVNFFQNIDTKNLYDFSYLQVYINDTLTEQEANSISASADDDIKIISTTNKYPWFGHHHSRSDMEYPDSKLDYIKSIEEPLPLMVDAGDTPISELNRCFFGCASLVSIPQGLFDNNPQVTSLDDCFCGCASLVSIPKGLFDNCPSVTNFGGCFEDCTSLTSIPQGLFDNNPQVTSFYSCFYNCKSLTSIPQGLFDNNPQVVSFDSCFYHCESLTDIPDGLFDNNPKVTGFGSCFVSCLSLSSIPQGLFDNNTLVKSFRNCFNICKSLTSIPTDLFNKHTQVTDFYYCFGNCNNLTVNVQIGSTASEVNADYFAIYTKEKGTVYCRAGSAAYQAFSTGTSANVNVLTY